MTDGLSRGRGSLAGLDLHLSPAPHLGVLLSLSGTHVMLLRAILETSRPSCDRSFCPVYLLIPLPFSQGRTFFSLIN